MAGDSLATLAVRLRGGRAVGALVLVLLVVGGLAAFTATIVEAPGRTAPWIPAIGVAAAAVLVAQKRYRLPVAVLASSAIALSGIAVGRPVLFSFALTAVAIIELLIFRRLVAGEGRLPRLDSVSRTLRFVLGSVAAAAVFASGVAVARILLGLPGAGVIPIDSFVAHLVALLIVTPLALVRRGHGGRARPREIVLQSAALGAAIVVVFAPANSLPLAFLTLPFLAWAALRLSAMVVAVQLTTVAFLSSAATLVGWGPFGVDAVGVDDVRGSIVLLQLYLVAFAGSTIVLWSKRVDGETRAEVASAKDRVLRRAIERAQTGILLVERIAPGIYVVVQANAHGLRALDLDPDDEYFAASSDINVALPTGHPLLMGLDAVMSGRGPWRESATLQLAAGRREVEVAIERGAGDAADVLSVELTDVTAAREEDRRLRAIVDRERALSLQYQELARQKDDFLASLSHELRTPLASIVGYAETLDETELDARQRQFLATIGRNADRLQDRVEELLSAAKTAADAVNAVHPIEVGRIVAEVADDLRPIAAARAISIRLPDDLAGLPAVLGTEDAITRSVTNILANAVKFTATGSAIDIEARPLEESIEIAIADEGPGIAPADQERVFERFYRTENALENAVPGTGLGLSIVRALLEGIGGAVAIHSDGVRGTRITITLRRALDAVEAPSASV